MTYIALNKFRNFIPAYRTFVHTWLDNFRYLQRSRMPPFGYSSFPTQNGVPPGSSTSSYYLNNAPTSVYSNYQQALSNSSNQATLYPYPGSEVTMIFAKTYELLASRDTNGPRLLAIITEELLNSANLFVSLN